MGRYGYALGDTMEPDALIARARKIEDAGFDAAWSNELFTSPFVPLATVAPHTSKIKLGSSIAYGFTRSPLETVITSLDLDAITNGRFILGLGSGVRRLNEMWHGVPNYGRPAPHLKECVQAIRSIIDGVSSGEPVRFEGEYYDIDMRGWEGPSQAHQRPRPHLHGRRPGRNAPRRRRCCRRRPRLPHVVPRMGQADGDSKHRKGPETFG